MKIHINRKVARFFSAALLASSLTACDDFLNILPLNDIVLENYWTEEADVTSVVNACYSQLCSGDCLKRMAVWGELRSDNLVAGGGASIDLSRIASENLLETNGYAKWDAFYQCINRCNTVIHYAPSVQQIDPNYTESELRANIAEVTALRALCYFYLIRTFRDVPYVTEPSIDDGQNYQVPPSSFEEVLGHLIADLEAVKDDAVRSYIEPTYGNNPVDNVNRITRNAIYALLADMYLWQGEYQKCIDYCDMIIKSKQDEYEEILLEQSSPDIELYGVFPLISEGPRNVVTAGEAYSQIFGKGNSFESIFELSFLDGTTQRENLAVKELYASTPSENSVSAGQLATPSYLTSEIASENNVYFDPTDNRVFENIERNGGTGIRKYVYDDVSFRNNNGTVVVEGAKFETRGSNTANWIVYRLTDVMLMKAEAEVQLAGIDAGNQERHFRSAWDCVIAVWKRANSERTGPDTLQYAKYGDSKLNMENLVLDERQRELMFEGKRWFDLVRLCRREGSNTRMVDKVIGKFEQNTSALRIRLASPDALYYPYHEDELRANPNLVQNPVYENESITTTE